MQYIKSMVKLLFSKKICVKDSLTNIKPIWAWVIGGHYKSAFKLQQDYLSSVQQVVTDSYIKNLGVCKFIWDLCLYKIIGASLGCLKKLPKDWLKIQ